MYEKTRGIVLHVVPYNDRLSVVHIYTERFGRMSYMLPRGTGRAARLARAMYTPLSLIEIESENRAGRSLNRIREAHSWILLPQLQSDPVRATVALFLAEFLGRVLVDSEPQPRLFAYVAQSVELLGNMPRGYANFHICFMVGLAPFVGVMPGVEGYREGYYFDMQEGVFVPHRPVIGVSLPPHEAQAMTRLLRMDYTNMHLFRFTRGERAAVLDRIIQYYGVHLPGVSNMKSPAVLQAIFDV